MKILNILSWILRTTLFIVILVLVLNNMQTVDFNLFSLYHMKLPLIVLVLIFFILGVFLGLLFGILRRSAVKSDAYKLEKEIHDQKATKPTN